MGLVSAACFADVGNDVVCVDKDASKVDILRSGKIPIYEPGLGDIVERSLRAQRLMFTMDLNSALKGCRICFITVDTPSDGEGKADLKNIVAVAEAIGDNLEDEIIVVTKSTVPVGTTLKVKSIIRDRLKQRGKKQELVRVVSNPEFLKEGDAINDFKKPDRVVVGVESGDDVAASILYELYSPFMRKRDKFLKMDVLSSELTKYASNAMLAARISFMNSLARLCDKAGANIELIRAGVGADPRIGSDFLFSGIGYGGSCFPKDVKALMNVAREYGERLPIVEATEDVNNEQVSWFFSKISGKFEQRGGLSDKIFAVWGAAFKGNTDDIRESRAVKLIELLLLAGAGIKLFDPEATPNVKRLFGNKVVYCDSMYDCVNRANALILCTDWNEFKSPNIDRIAEVMKQVVIFDGRNLISHVHYPVGTKYYGVGIPSKE